MYHDDYDYADACPGCGVRDYGYDLPDERAVYYIPCECPQDSEDCCCMRDKVTINIVRHYGDCDYCHGHSKLDRCEFTVTLYEESKENGRTKGIATVPSESLAHAVIQDQFPGAETYRDEAWESERHLRMIGG